jgi:tetratricopeptide (TPR) repeat protein
LLAGIIYGPLLGAGWFYDDEEFIVNDPRLNHIELFSPNHWFDPPTPPSPSSNELHAFASYEKPLIADRYVFRLSFALERKVLDGTPSPALSHAINLVLHLACITALFFVLMRLTELYLSTTCATGASGCSPCSHTSGTLRNAHSECWRIFPGVGALIFSIHPWASEPVCYATARSGSLGTLFTLLGLLCWIAALNRSRKNFVRIAYLLGSGLCALAAFGSKENFITAPVGYLLATGPILWQRIGSGSKLRIAILFFSATALLILVAGLGLKFSHRAEGLWAQIGDGRGWHYFFEIQNPLLLSTLADQLPVQRISIETNHPHWSTWACLCALLGNGILLVGSIFGGFRWPLLLCLSWFYLHLLPTNSFLPRPDFLATRNFYLPVAGTSALMAGLLIWSWIRFGQPLSKLRSVILGGGVLLGLYWSFCASSWSRAFLSPDEVWARSALVAPDHSVVHINLAYTLSKRRLRRMNDENISRAAVAHLDLDKIQEEYQAALTAENSLTMSYHSERPKATRRSLALLSLAIIYQDAEDFEQAEQYFRKSLEYVPLVEAWIGWMICGSSKGSKQEALEFGFAQWPDEWWPKAARAWLYVEPPPVDVTTLPPDILADFSHAENAPNATGFALKSLQCSALYYLAKTEGRLTDRAVQLLNRIETLGGMRKQDIAGLRAELQTRR